VKTRQLATAGLGLVAALTFAITGCSGTAGNPVVGESGPGTGTPSPGSAEAATALATAAGEISKTSYKVTTTWGPSTSLVGSMDPPKKLGQTSFTTTMENSNVKIDSLMIDKDVYLKINGVLPALEGKWLHVDVQRLSPDSQIGFTPGVFDPATSERLLQTAAEVRRVGDRGFVGTLDLTKAAGMALFNSDQTTVNLGEQAKAVPFEATTDEQNRLVGVKIMVPATSANPSKVIDTRYTDFGTPVTVQAPPAGQVTEAPDVFYQTVGGR
jgi:hypothetical protein